jgi:FHS family L-fucose permease-like MFS transporter
MTDTLLAAFKRIMDMTDTQTSLILSAFYGSYFCFALPAALFIRKYSYRAGVVLGLVLYATGALLFFPAAKAASYAFYLVAIYIMAGGCSVLETTANPYIMAMGTPETATRRLNIAQSFNPVGSIAGILVSKYLILDNISLYSVSKTYTALGCLLLAIMTVMLFAKMPAGRDAAIGTSLKSTFTRLIANKHYVYGVVAQFFYVGAQVGVWSYTIRIVMQEMGVLEAEASNIFLISMVAFCLSRFFYTWLMKWVRPIKLLVASGVLSMLCSVAVAFTAGKGLVMVIFLVLISLFMSLMFPTIYGTALGGITSGEHPDDSKIAASILIMSILGGALIPSLQGLLSDATSIYVSYLVPAFCFAVVLCYAVFAMRKGV